MKLPSVEDAMKLVHDYRDKDPAVVALARAYVTLMTQREVCSEKWEKLTALVTSLKRTFDVEK